MPEQNRNRIRSFHAPEKPRATKPTTMAGYVSRRHSADRIISAHAAPKKTRPFSRNKRFVNTNSRFGLEENHNPETKQVKEATILPPIGDNIRVIPLGGAEEVGRNMTAVEIGNDIIIIDVGFQFKDEDSPGIDYILPNTKYLEERKEKIRGIFITHAHLDHIGGIPYIMDRIGNPTIYARQFSAIMIQKRQEEFTMVAMATHIVSREQYLQFITEKWPDKERLIDFLASEADTFGRNCPPISSDWLYRLLARFGRKIEQAENPEACLEAFLEVLEFLQYPEPGW